MLPEDNSETLSDELQTNRFEEDDSDFEGDLIRNLNLPKDSSELLTSTLKEKNVLHPDTKIIYYRNRDKRSFAFFSRQDDMVFYNNIKGLLEKMGTNVPNGKKVPIGH
uniref:Uncharacterized protein LOC114333248 n=1 Tax=Diabrotica virgifera virgifera TaxID=50390 RepID=A0A6P7G2T7_DIAVI